MKSIVVATVVLGAAAVLYGTRLDAPALQPEETMLSLHASRLATHGWRDGAGRALPLLVQATPDTWLPALPVYAAAVLPIDLESNPSAIRWLSVAAGSASIALMYVEATLVLGSPAFGLIAASLLLLTPSVFIYSRSAQQDGIWVLPFFITWLIGMTLFLKGPRGGQRASMALFVAVASLSASIYSQPSATLTGLALGFLTLLTVARSGHPLRTYTVPIALGIVPALPLLVWLTMHYRAAYPDTFGRWLLHETNLRHPVEWAKTLANRQLWIACSGNFWDFFSPTDLMANANGPGDAAMFAAPVVPLALYGWYVGTNRADSAELTRFVSWTIVGGALVAALFRDPRATQRALILAPAVALLATMGIATTLKLRSAAAVIAVLLLALAVPVQLSMGYRGLVRASSMNWLQSRR